MTTVVLTHAEHAETLALAAVSDPPRHGIAVGEPRAAAALQACIPETYDRATDGCEVPLGWSVSSTYARDSKTGEVDVRPDAAAKMAADKGCSVGLKTKLLAVVDAEPIQEVRL